MRPTRARKAYDQLTEEEQVQARMQPNSANHHAETGGHRPAPISQIMAEA